jgi:hypothetical protein
VPLQFRLEVVAPDYLTMTMRKIASIFIVVAMASLLSGCVGPRFTPVTTVPADKALIYIYRNAAVGGVLGNHHVFANGKPITSLYSGSYYPYLAEPGTNYLSSKQYSLAVILDMTANINFRDRVCRIDAEASKTYYVQFEIATTWGPKLTQVNAEKGAKDIHDCDLAKPLK